MWLGLLSRWDVRVDDSPWNRLLAEAQAEVVRLIDIGRNVQAIALMRELVGLPQPGVEECVELPDQLRK